MIFLLLLVSFSATAESRLSSVNLSGTRGPEEYKAATLDGLIAIGKEWALTGSAFQSDSGVGRFLNEELISNEVRLGTDWQINSTWNVAGEVISRQDPYEVSGRGAAVSTRVVLSDFWKAKKSTSLRFKIEQIRYTQDLTIQGRFASLEIERDITQKSALIMLDQEFADWLSASISHTRYNYTAEADQLALTTARRRTSIGGNSANYGLPDRVTALEIVVTPLEWLETRLGTSRSKILDDDTDVKTNSLGFSFFWESWQLDLDGSRTDYGDTSGDDEDKQNYVSAGIGYNW